MSRGRGRPRRGPTYQVQDEYDQAPIRVEKLARCTRPWTMTVDDERRRPTANDVRTNRVRAWAARARIESQGDDGVAVAGGRSTMAASDSCKPRRTDSMTLIGLNQRSTRTRSAFSLTRRLARSFSASPWHRRQRQRRRTVSGAIWRRRQRLAPYDLGEDAPAVCDREGVGGQIGDVVAGGMSVHRQGSRGDSLADARRRRHRAMPGP